MEKKLYRVKPGFTHGARKQYKAGDTVELTEHEAAGFLDKLQLIGESQPYSGLSLSEGGLLVTPTDFEKAKDEANAQPDQPVDVANTNIDEVLAAVKEGKIAASTALVAEQQGSKKRATLIAELTKLAEEENKPQE